MLPVRVVPVRAAGVNVEVPVAWAISMKSSFIAFGALASSASVPAVTTTQYLADSAVVGRSIFISLCKPCLSVRLNVIVDVNGVDEFSPPSVTKAFVEKF